MRIAFRCGVMVLVGSLVCGTALAREARAERESDAREECSNTVSRNSTGSRIRQEACEDDDTRRSPLRNRRGIDQVADTLHKDVASGSALSRAQTN